MNFRNQTFTLALVSIFTIILIASSLTFLNPTVHVSPTPQLLSPVATINSINIESTTNYSINSIPTIEYSLRVNVNINFPSTLTFNSPGLNACSFGVSLGSSNWSYLPQTWICPLSSPKTYKGLYNFFIPKIIYSNSSISNYPVLLNITVFSNTLVNLNVTSQPYTLKINSAGYESITITQASLSNFTQQDGSTGYYIKTTFNLLSYKPFNVTYGCSSPFTVSLVNTSNWYLVHVDCQALLTHYLPAGTSTYSLSYQLMNPNSQIYNYTTPLPSNFYLQVTLGNNLLKSNVYILAS